MIDWIMSFKFNSLLGVLLYWVPLSLCIYGYTLRTWFNYKKDLLNRNNERYTPTDTIGDLVGRGVVTLIPVANIWAATFDVAPEVFKRFFKLLGEIFDKPLVPSRGEKK